MAEILFFRVVSEIQCVIFQQNNVLILMESTITREMRSIMGRARAGYDGINSA